ncbi:DUF6266 family protein [Sphingobacterium faecale]|uniref:Uncharacterized protein n=1 Tax=Sphingobacterium faecale TaxID=2803775 RepID=A0ABS1QYZ1_9SPHI|nr:DUF6266 family protein [Sphingobacterium faecale]MBL1407653.1 hypothetical protein [Sphingobacterium faecale]
MNTKKASAEVHRIRTKFVLGNRFLAPLGPIVSKGFGMKAQQGKRKGWTPRNFALSHLLRFAVIGSYPDLRIDPAKVLLSDGNIEVPQDVGLESADQRLIVSFDTSRLTDFNHDDRVILVAYQIEDGVAIANTEQALRRDGRVELDVPEYLWQRELHLYLLLCDRAGTDYSRSMYLGERTIG